MCELLIFTEPRGGDRFPGDTVTVRPDGWPWSTSELGAGAHPFWRVVRLPGVPAMAFMDMLTPSTDSSGRIRAYRAKHFAMPLLAQPSLDDMNAARRIKAFSGAIG